VWEEGEVRGSKAANQAATGCHHGGLYRGQQGKYTTECATQHIVRTCLCNSLRTMLAPNWQLLVYACMSAHLLPPLRRLMLRAAAWGCCVWASVGSAGSWSAAEEGGSSASGASATRAQEMKVTVNTSCVSVNLWHRALAAGRNVKHCLRLWEVSKSARIQPPALTRLSHCRVSVT
jgi:hypothetical protein